MRPWIQSSTRSGLELVRIAAGLAAVVALAPCVYSQQTPAPKEQAPPEQVVVQGETIKFPTSNRIVFRSLLADLATTEQYSVDFGEGTGGNLQVHSPIDVSLTEFWKQSLPEIGLFAYRDTTGRQYIVTSARLERRFHLTDPLLNRLMREIAQTMDAARPDFESALRWLLIKPSQSDVWSAELEEDSIEIDADRQWLISRDCRANLERIARSLRTLEDSKDTLQLNLSTESFPLSPGVTDPLLRQADLELFGGIGRSRQAGYGEPFMQLSLDRRHVVIRHTVYGLRRAREILGDPEVQTGGLFQKEYSLASTQEPSVGTRSGGTSSGGVSAFERTTPLLRVRTLQSRTVRDMAGLFR